MTSLILSRLELVVAGDQHLADRRLLLDREGQRRAPPLGADLGLDVDVGEEAHLPHRADVLAQLRGVEQRAGLGQQLDADRVVLDLAVAAELDALDRPALHARAASPAVGGGRRSAAAPGSAGASAGAAASARARTRSAGRADGTSATATRFTMTRSCVAWRDADRGRGCRRRAAATAWRRPCVSSTRRPPSTMRSRRGISAARSGLWVTTSSVEPRSRLSSRNSWWIASPVERSRLPVGSSARSSDGSSTIARASATRCCSPPDSSPGRWVRRCESPTRPRMSRAFARARSTAIRWISAGIITFSSAVNSGSR